MEHEALAQLLGECEHDEVVVRGLWNAAEAKEQRESSPTEGEEGRAADDGKNGDRTLKECLVADAFELEVC